MRRRSNRVIGIVTAMLAVTAISPATGSAYQDERSPDAIDAARVSQVSNYQDERSPDAVDAATASLAGTPPSVTYTSTSTGSSSGDSDWDTAGYIGGGVLVLLLTGFGCFALIARRGRRTPAITG
jgi:hypothetical protein